MFSNLFASKGKASEVDATSCGFGIVAMIVSASLLIVLTLKLGKFGFGPDGGLDSLWDMMFPELDVEIDDVAEELLEVAQEKGSQAISKIDKTAFTGVKVPDLVIPSAIDNEALFPNDFVTENALTAAQRRRLLRRLF